MATEITSSEVSKEPSDSTDLKNEEQKNERSVTKVFPIADMTLLELLKSEILKVSQLDKPEKLVMTATDEPR